MEWQPRQPGSIRTDPLACDARGKMSMAKLDTSPRSKGDVDRVVPHDGRLRHTPFLDGSTQLAQQRCGQKRWIVVGRGKTYRPEGC
eukprot:scaffold663_cov341-Pavlova_lutheri.AAC.6